MSIILLSINPQFLEPLFKGIKKYEYRKVKPKNEIDKILFYATSPLKKVVGEAEVETIVEGTPSDIWELTKNDSGISEKFFKSYYLTSKKAIAFKLRNVIKYDLFLDLEEFNINFTPQSFIYL